MKIVGVAACTVGIAHTYIVEQEKLENAAKKAGHEIHVETQGTIGIGNELPQEAIDRRYRDFSSGCQDQWTGTFRRKENHPSADRNRGKITKQINRKAMEVVSN